MFLVTWNHFTELRVRTQCATETAAISWPCSEHWCWKSSVQAHRAAAAEPRLQAWIRWKRHWTHPDYPLQSSKGCLEGWISWLHRQQAWRKVSFLNTPGGLAIPSPQEGLRPPLVSLRSLDANGLGSPCVQMWPQSLVVSQLLSLKVALGSI